MRTHKIKFHDEKKKISLNKYFLEQSKEFRRDSKNKFELAIINEPSVFELLRFYCTKFLENQLLFTQVIVQKRNTDGRTYYRRSNGRTDGRTVDTRAPNVKP